MLRERSAKTNEGACHEWRERCRAPRGNSQFGTFSMFFLCQFDLRVLWFLSQIIRMIHIKCHAEKTTVALYILLANCVQNGLKIIYFFIIAG
jgi:hypothetical protein